MKKVILTAICILAMVIIVPINDALAENSHIIFEMGESGQTVSFPITPKGLNIVAAEKGRQIKNEVRNSQKAQARFQTLEMGESGQKVSYLMTPEMIAAEDAEKRRLSEIRRKSNGVNRKTIAYETAESGILIEFPERAVKINSVSIVKIERP